MSMAFTKRDNPIRAQAAQLSGEQANRSPGHTWMRHFSAMDSGAGNLQSKMVMGILEAFTVSDIVVD